ncbi:MAG: hypothetical protein RL748_3281 [Pseudomonadota bacterium]|jgi:apolipoprotein D and lipocalin family protein
MKTFLSNLSSRLFITTALSASALYPAHAAEKPAAATTAVTSVASVDLQRYLGTWNEAARLPMWFQRQCISDVTAQYGLLENGKISVLNRCRTKDGSFDQAEGKASVVENSSNARLKVSFFWPFSGDYWVIGLDPEYRWAVVGEPKRKYLWILSRTSPMAASDLAAAKQIAVAQGYDLSTLVVNGEAKAAAN